MVRWMALALVTLTATGWAQDNEAAANRHDDEVRQLLQRVAALERLVQALQEELAALKRNGAAPSGVLTQLIATQQQADDEKRKLEEELGLELKQQKAPPRPTPSYGAAVFGGVTWQALNPDISVIANFRTAFRGNRPLGNFGGSDFNAAELAFQAATDPFSRLDTFIDVGPDKVEIDEATLSILDPSFLRLPKGLQIKLGLLRAPLGQLNMIHSEEQPFTVTPLVHQMWFEEEGFNGQGLSLNWMLPTGKSVTWLTVAPLNADNQTFRAGAGRPIWLARLRNLRELSPTQSLNLGLSYAFGRNDTDNDTRLFGADLTYRWRPIREGLYRSLVWQTEAYWAQRDKGNGSVKPFGFFSLLEYQLSRTLFLGLRYDFAQAPDKSFSGRGWSLAITLFPSEFGRYRLQWSRLKLGGQTVHEVWLQTTFSIGVHRPHPL